MKKMPGDIILSYIYVYHKWKSSDICFLKYKVQQTEILHILGHFCPFSLLTTWKIKIITLEKNTWRYYHFTHLHHKWQSYVFVILDHFLYFHPLTTQKFKILKKWKKRPGDTIILHKCTINDNHMMYYSWGMKHDRELFVILDYFLNFYPPSNLKNHKILKKWKKCLEILQFYTYVPYMTIIWCMVPEISRTT